MSPSNENRVPASEGWGLGRNATQEGVGLAIGGGSSNIREGWDGLTQDPDDFPLGKACDLSGDGTCESCQ